MSKPRVETTRQGEVYPDSEIGAPGKPRRPVQMPAVVTRDSVADAAFRRTRSEPNCHRTPYFKYQRTTASSLHHFQPRVHYKISSSDNLFLASPGAHRGWTGILREFRLGVHSLWRPEREIAQRAG